MQNTFKPPEFGDINAMEAMVKSLPPGRPKLALTIAQLVMQAFDNADKSPTRKKPRKKSAS